MTSPNDGEREVFILRFRLFSEKKVLVSKSDLLNSERILIFIAFYKYVFFSFGM